MKRASKSSIAADPYLHDIVAEVGALLGEPWECAPALVSRRSFLKITGLAAGGFGLLVLSGGRLGRARAEDTGATPARLNAFVQVARDGTIFIFAKNPEIGQGVKTALPMIVAEELDADWSDVTVLQAPVNESVYGRQAAGGSRSVPSSWDLLRKAGAAARAMLISAAAAEWRVPAAQCRTEASHVFHDASGRSLGYGELADRAARAPVPAERSLVLKERSEYRLLGARITGVDNRAIVTGAPLFGIDQVLPGMLYAVYEKCPATGGRVESANLDEIRALPGVRWAFALEGNGRVSELMPGVAIVANSTWAALKARKALKVKWDERHASRDSWTAIVAAAEKLKGSVGPTIVKSVGDVDAVLATGRRQVEAFYTYQFAAHANLEPQNCTAWYRDGSIELWGPTQAPGRGIAGVAHTLNIPEDRVIVHQMRAGGGFGRRLVNDPMCEAAAIARQIDAPVKLMWTREDDLTHDFFRAGGFHSLRGTLDGEGRISAWQDHLITFSADGRRPVSGGGVSEHEFPTYQLPNYQLSQTLMPLDTPCGAWRAPGSNVTAWVVQSFLNELAVAAGRDHLEMLLEVMGEPRWLAPGNPGALHTGRAAAVIRLAAEKAGWGRTLPPGRGLGLAFHFSHAGHVAEVAEVSVDDRRKLRLHRVTVAVDVGPIINLSGAESQCQGAVVDGFSTMLGLEITMEKGRIEQTSLRQYPLLRMEHAPEVEVHFIESDYAPTGLGEPALPPLAPAVCNAIYAAAGHRVQRLPLTREGFSV